MIRPSRILETHDEALPIWRDAGACAALVHVDAHHDMWSASSATTPANAVRAALRERLADSVYWIVPDPAWSSAASRAALRKHLRRISDRSARIVESRSAIDTVVESAPVRVRPLSGLPPVGPAMRLDIDADFMTIASIDYKRREHPGAPWISAAALAGALRPIAKASDVTTIVRSCDGGFTPLVHRTIADDLAARLDGDEARAGVFGSVAAALGLDDGGEHDRAVRMLRQLTPGPARAAASYALATIAAKHDELSEARSWCERAVAADPAYRSPYRSRGFIEYFAGRYARAAAEFARTLAMDPDDAFALMGAGMAARAGDRLSDAEAALSRAIDCDPDLVDAWRERAEIHVRRHRWDAARRDFLAALALIHARHPAIGPDGWREGAPDGPWIQARLSLVAQRTGDFAAARRYAVEARAAGFDSPALRRRLTAMAVWTGAWRSAKAHAAAALRLSAREYVHAVRVGAEDLTLAVRR